jgi:hypothetical protein
MVLFSGGVRVQDISVARECDLAGGRDLDYSKRKGKPPLRRVQLGGAC